jgi:L-threonylcarbamoyladenylate synthase
MYACRGLTRLLRAARSYALLVGEDLLVTKDTERVAACVQAGGLAVVPTETVYGLGADADQPAAVARLFEVKGRPASHPLIVHLGSAEDLDRWVASVPPSAATLAETCWPGPLTLLLPRSRRVLDVVTGGRDTVGLRVPAHPATLDVLTRTGGGLAAPSANRYGAVSPTTVRHVLDELGEALDPATDVILDGGPSPVGVESTIVDCSVDPPQILRPGGIPTETVAELLGAPLAAASGPSRAAGMVASHYAPRARVHLVDRPVDATAAVERFGAAGIDVRVIDGTSDLVRYARTLYAELRDADADGCTDIIAVLPPPIGLGHAIRDRLQKASAHR